MHTWLLMNSGDKANIPKLLPDETDLLFTGRSSLLLFASVVALFVAARLWHLTASCLWFDEIFSVHAARHTWLDMMHFVAADIIHPPLFYALLKVWISVGGESLLWLRLFPALISIAAIIPFVLFCRELKITSGTVTLALLLMAVNGYLIKYAQELRMYSLLFFFSLGSLWLFLKFVNTEAGSKKQLLALLAINLLLVYTHYAGWLLVGLEAITLLLWQRSRLRSFLLSAAILVLLYLPWLYEVARVTKATEPGKGLGQNIGWVMRPHLLDVVQYFTELNKPFLFRQSSADALVDPWSTCLAVALIGFPLIVFSWLSFRSSTKTDSAQLETVRPLFLFAFAPVVVVFLLSWILPYSVWGTRHLIFTAGPYSGLAALAIRRLQPNWIRIILSLVLGCWFLLAGTIFFVRRPPEFIWCAWNQLAREMISLEGTSDGPVEIYAYEDLVAYHLWFPLSTTDNARFKVTVVKGVPGIVEDPAYFLPRSFNDIAVQHSPALGGDHMWIAFRAKQWDEKSAPLNYLASSGYQIGRVLRAKAQGQDAFLVELWRNKQSRH
jgi:uncharacterized membrane protein